MTESNEPSGPTPATLKRLFARCGNKCAFPKCPVQIFDGTVLVGEACHIKGAKPGSPRYDPDQTPEDRHSCRNLIVMCGTHHTVIDNDVESYSVERLQKMKADHERAAALMADEDINRAVNLLTDASIKSFNQKGGYTAQQITHIQNYYAASTDHPVTSRWQTLELKFGGLEKRPFPVFCDWVHTIETEEWQWWVRHPSEVAVKMCIELCKEAGRLLLSEPSFMSTFPEIASIPDDCDRWLLAIYKVAGIGKVRANGSSMSGGLPCTTNEYGDMRDLPGAAQVLCRIAINGFQAGFAPPEKQQDHAAQLYWPEQLGEYIAATSDTMPLFPPSLSGFRPTGENQDFWNKPFRTRGCLRVFEGRDWEGIADFPRTMNGCSHGVFMIRWRSAHPSISVRSSVRRNSESKASEKAGAFGYMFGTNCEQPMFRFGETHTGATLVDLFYELKFWQAAP